MDQSDPFKGVNPFDPAFRENPYLGLAHLRANAPVDEMPIGVWRLSRYDDCVRLLHEVPTGMRLTGGLSPIETFLPSDIGLSRFMLQQDPPAHTRLRGFVSQAFTPRRVEQLRAQAQTLADRAIDRALEKGEIDAIGDLALPVPLSLICEMMGVPPADRERFTEWTARATHLLAAPFAPQEALDSGIAASRSLQTYLADLIAEHGRAPRADILSDLIRACDEDDRLTPDELITQAVGLLIAGFETTIGLIGNGVLQLVRHPDELAKLHANPALVGCTVEECLRYDGPIMFTLRVLREDTRFGDSVIPKDRVVMALLVSANRDPAKFTNPESFDVTRTPNEHLAFGGGPHFCLGAHLARMEAQVAIGTLVRRAVRLELDEAPLEWGRSLFRVLARLPLRVASV